jgi:hypothetical protein
VKTLSLIATTALLLAGIGIAGAAAPNDEKSATAKTTKEAKKPTAKAPAGTVKQKTTEDNIGEPK